MAVLQIASVLIAFLLIIESDAAKSDKEILDCIKQKMDRSIGKPYTDHYDKLRFTNIVRVKKALEEVWKEEKVVTVHKDKQMTLDKTQFSNYAAKMKNDVGRAMTSCKNNSDDRMYAEVARGTQCVFEELKQTCSKR